jgi:hypothetical protein
MIKKFFSALVVVLFATSMMAQTGLTCEDPIPVDKNYQGRVDGPCELWYTANTYDLPLHVYFSPDSAGSKISPEVYIDFSCTSGVYDDPKLDSLLTKISIFGLELPLEFMCDGIFRNGKNEWDLSVSKTYREQLAESGITYNVQALIRVVYHEGGSISLTPDTAFTSCMDNEYVQLGDTIEILPNDADRVFVMPFTDWQNDSIRFVWVGEQEANVWLAVQYCEFTPNSTSSFVWDTYHLTADAPRKLQPQQIVDIIKEHKEGGVYYGKVIAPVAGKLVVEKIPMAPIKGGATLLEYGKSVKVNDATQLFCFPRTWLATEFVSSANRAITMYMSSTPDFTPSVDDANLLASQAFSAEDGEYHNYISKTEMTAITSATEEDYIYVRFQCASPTTIVADVWDASSCANKSLMIRPNQQFAVAAKSKSTIYRLFYDDWKNCDVTIKWTGSSKLPTYIADTCSFVLSSTSSRVVKYASISSRGTLKLDAATIESWASRVDADGYLYACFNPTNKGNVTFVAEKLAGFEPVYTTDFVTICFGETYTWNGKEYSESGEYEQTFTTTNGADSIVTLNLTILPEVPETVENVTIKGGDTYAWQGQEYVETGRYTTTLADMNGCDSVLVLNLTVLPKTNPCVESSTKLNIGDQLTLNLNNAFTVYCINYAEWAAQGATLQWTGEEPLHTFVAETCQFAVAPYNKFVHLYLPIIAETALDMNALAPYVDDAGYLYIRFLTEKEGVLTIK